MICQHLEASLCFRAVCALEQKYIILGPSQSSFPVLVNPFQVVCYSERCLCLLHLLHVRRAKCCVLTHYLGSLNNMVPCC